MKNIHLIPTDKPSRLVRNHTNKLLLTIQYLPLDKEIGCFSQHIYITSDEKPKEGNWVDDGTNNPYKWTKNDVEDCLYNPGVANYKGCKKIILTTDQDLINDGIQSIDDEFLEWFVNNPSCDEVEVHELKLFNPDTNGSGFCKWELDIPKEEPNPFELPKALPDDVFYESLEEPKQESPEEAAARYTCGWGENDDEKAFIAGAKWMQERMYSEEDIALAFNEGQAYSVTGKLVDGKEWAKTHKKEWFEQFKKK
jgi:hypothetical protein